MELNVRTLRGGAVVLKGLDPGMDVEQLKSMLSENQNLSLPAPPHQRLVFCNRALDKGPIGAVLKDGDVLVAIGVAAPPPQPEMPSTPEPDAATIRAAVVAEARRRGVEEHLVEERPGVPPDLLAMEQPLLQLLQALEGQIGRVGGLGAMGHGGAAGAAAGGLTAAADGASADAGVEAGLLGAAGAAGPAPGNDPLTAAMQQLANAFGVPMDQLHQGGVPAHEHAYHRRAFPPNAAQQPAAPEAAPDVRAPDPPAAAIEQLTSMGFTEPAVRKALALSRNNVESALEWLLEHGGDADAEEPPTQEQLRQVYGQPARRHMTESEAVGQLMEMGFARDQATAAIRRFRNVELALAYLLQAGPGVMAAPPGPLQVAAHEAGGAAPADGTGPQAVASRTGAVGGTALPLGVAALGMTAGTQPGGRGPAAGGSHGDHMDDVDEDGEDEEDERGEVDGMDDHHNPHFTAALAGGPTGTGGGGLGALMGMHQMLQMPGLAVNPAGMGMPEDEDEEMAGLESEAAAANAAVQQLSNMLQALMRAGVPGAGQGSTG